MEKFDSYKVLQSARDTVSKTYTAQTEFLKYLIKKSKSEHAKQSIQKTNNNTTK